MTASTAPHRTLTPIETLALRRDAVAGHEIALVDLLAVIDELRHLRVRVREAREEAAGARVDAVRAELEVARLRQSAIDQRHGSLHGRADAWHEGWASGVRNACAVHCPDVDIDEAVAAVEQSGLEENTYLALLDCDPEADG